MAEKFCLKWNDFHSNVSKSFGMFRNEDYLHDVTLVSDDHLQVSAHKLVVATTLNNQPKEKKDLNLNSM